MSCCPCICDDFKAKFKALQCCGCSGGDANMLISSDTVMLSSFCQGHSFHLPVKRHAILIASVYSQNIIHGICCLPNGAGLLFIVCFLSQTSTFLKIHGFVFLHQWPIKPLFVTNSSS